MNLTVADLLIAAISGPEALWFLKTEKRPGHGLRALHFTISDMYWIASLGNCNGVTACVTRLVISMHIWCYEF